jgi:cytochrome oxidase assembly protein ShyY1
MNKAPSFFTVARQPKWIGALFLSLAVAAIFASLSQWQLDRAFTKDNEAPTAINIESANVKIDTKNVYIVANRLNGSQRGYWLITNSVESSGKNLTIALGWSADLVEVQGEREALMTSGLEKVDTKLEGVFIPSEAPLPQQSADIFESLSLAQLVNAYSPDKPIKIEKQILALNGYSQASAWPPLKPINVAYAQGQKINWLSAFYFLEWLLFAGFAVFLWWRLVKDEQLLLTVEATGEKVN